MKELISNNLIESLQNQVAHEKFNANIYLYFASVLKNKGFNNIAKHFEEQHEEETGHSLIIYNLLTDLNANFIIPEINEVAIPINNIMDMATAYLDREMITTDSLNEIKLQAIEENNPVVEERMREMIKLQQNEYAESSDFMDKASLTGNNWMNVLIWDLGLG